MSSKRSGSTRWSLVLALALGAVALAGTLTLYSSSRAHAAAHGALEAVAVDVARSASVASYGGEDCELREEHTYSLPARGLDRLDLTAKSGILVVEGRAGLDEVRVDAVFCASDEENLEALDVTVEAVSSTARLETIHPDWQSRSRGRNYARIDLTIQVPAGMAADISDGSGGAELSGLGDLDLRDGSGSLQIDDISGWLRVADGSGDIEVRGVDGDVEVEDGSGSVYLRDIDGDVRLSDGSGEARINEVTGSVIVSEKGSGRVNASDIEGDLRVDGMRRERIDYANVRGELDLPPARRKRGS